MKENLKDILDYFMKDGEGHVLVFTFILIVIAGVSAINGLPLVFSLVSGFAVAFVVTYMLRQRSKSFRR